MTGARRFVVTTCSFLVLVASSRAQQITCDPQLLQPPSDPNGYRLREDRCEGVYIRQVAGETDLSVASLTEFFQDYDLSSGSNLRLDWSHFAEPLHVRATALRPHTYYRMDSFRPAGSTTYFWKTGVLASLQLGHNDVGIIGWVVRRVGQDTRNIYVPLRVSQTGPPTRSEAYQLVLYPGADLTEVYLTLAPVRPNGSSGQYLIKNKPLRYHYYPAERGIAVSIPRPAALGVYRLDIGAALRNGQTTNTRIWFLRP
jgi:hypothetical protein